MAEEETTPNSEAAASDYLKDVSYESPQTPQVFATNTNWQPAVSLHLNTESTKLENDLFESVLTVTATVKLGEETSMVQKGGFPQLLLDPVNFDALYAQHVEASRQNAPAPETKQ